MISHNHLVPCKSSSLGQVHMVSFRLVRIQSICSQENKCDRKNYIHFGKDNEHCGKKMLVRSIRILYFSQNVFKMPLIQVVESLNFVEDNEE